MGWKRGSIYRITFVEVVGLRRELGMEKQIQPLPLVAVLISRF